MHRRTWLSIAALAVGTALLVAAGVAAPSAESKSSAASAAKIRSGGTLRVNIAGSDVDAIDPSIAYGTTSWNMEYATALKLLNYPDARGARGTRIRPDGASRYTISGNGRVYTFFIRPGYRFSNGERVTARSYAYALNRSLNRELQSPAFQFIADPNATNIVGAERARTRGGNASGIRTRGNRLIIRLTRPNPAFLAELTMPFYQAMSTRLPRNREVINVNDRNDLPSAGPYYIVSRDPNRSIVMRRNPNYRGPRPHRLQQINFRMQVNLQSGFNEVEAGQADYQEGIPPAEHAGLRRRFGVNRSQYWVYPTNCTSYIALNNANPLFRGNVRLRKAVNFAINRAAMTAQYGVAGGPPTDQILPPLIPGYRNARIYPNRPNLNRARQLARGATRTGRGILYHGLTPPGPQVAELVRASMRAIGLNLELRGYRGFAIYEAAGRRGADFAMTVGTGWCKDYPDPYDFINILLYGGNIQAENNNNLAYFNNPTYNRRMNRAARLRGQTRYRVYGQLDIDISRNQAPWASWRIPNNRFFIGRRVNPRSFVYQPVYENPAYTLLALR
ncbi:MAG: ABC transporter substrate-binding protein [Actinomycetota bacterium]|nr:ABC transporter substrate-binding protein [Actinomycetota bacterium]